MTRVRPHTILTMDEVQVALARSPSAPSLHTPTLLKDVRTLVTEVKVKACEVTVVDSWPIVKERVLLRANLLGHEWVYAKNPERVTGAALGSWVGKVYPDDSVAVVWWTDEFIDHQFTDHSYENLLGRNCSTWERVATELDE